MTTQEKLIRSKLGLLDLAAYLGNVSEACRTLGYSRDTFYRLKNRFEEAGIDGLQELSRRKPNPKNRVAEEVEQAVCELALEYPAFGQVRAAAKLFEIKEIQLSPGGIRSIWQRNDLETKKKRLKALEKKVAEEGCVLTEAQLQALESAQQEKEAFGEIETEHPGYLGAQDTFYVGTMKGVGRIYQQTFIDTYCRVAFCKLYPMKTPITAADLLRVGSSIQVFGKPVSEIGRYVNFDHPPTRPEPAYFIPAGASVHRPDPARSGRVRRRSEPKTARTKTRKMSAVSSRSKARR